MNIKDGVYIKLPKDLENEKNDIKKTIKPL